MKKALFKVLNDPERVLVGRSEAVFLFFSSWMKLAFLTNTSGKIPVRR